MSLIVDIDRGHPNTVFTFETTLSGSNRIDFGDGSFGDISSSESTSHTYGSYGVYEARITDCNGLPSTPTIITVSPFRGDMINIIEHPTEEQAGVMSEEFVVEVFSNCPPPLRIQLSSNGSDTPYINKLNDDYLRSVTPKKSFQSVHSIDQNNILSIESGDLTPFIVDGGVHGYAGEFRFTYNDDYVGDVEICASLIRTCDLCDTQLRYNDENLVV